MDTLISYSRALHAAVATDSYMILYGGQTNEEWKWRDTMAPISIFVYSCGLWVNLHRGRPGNKIAFQINFGRKLRIVSLFKPIWKTYF
jgi:hypothetical protein